MAANPPTLVIYGADGQLGRALAGLPPPAGWAVRLAARPEVDIADAASVERVVAGLSAGLVVNAAAYTAVDKAESEPDIAFAVNAGGAANIADAAGCRGLAMVQLSTDFVFDGTKTGAYDEDDAPNPVSVYGASKLAGEQAVQQRLPRHVVLRTAWVFSADGACFPRTILKLLRQRDEVRVVDDQWGCPTAAEHLAQAILQMAPELAAAPAGDRRFGLFHCCGAPPVSRYGFAQAVAEQAQAQGLAVGRVVPCATDIKAATARRPANSELSCARLTAIHGLPPPPWQTVLPAYVKIYGGES